MGSAGRSGIRRFAARPPRAGAASYRLSALALPRRCRPAFEVRPGFLELLQAGQEGGQRGECGHGQRVEREHRAQAQLTIEHLGRANEEQQCGTEDPDARKGRVQDASGQAQAHVGVHLGGEHPGPPLDGTPLGVGCLDRLDAADGLDESALGRGGGGQAASGEVCDPPAGCQEECDLDGRHGRQAAAEQRIRPAGPGSRGPPRGGRRAGWRAPGRTAWRAGWPRSACS